MTIEIINQIITITVGLITFYTFVTKPLTTSIDNLKKEIYEARLNITQTRELAVRINESVKSAHKRIDKLEDFYEHGLVE